MASSSKKKTTFAKMTRENKVRERQQMKAAKRESRKQEPTMSPPDVLSEVVHVAPEPISAEVLANAIGSV
jgi:hypothetical protein